MLSHPAMFNLYYLSKQYKDNLLHYLSIVEGDYSVASTDRPQQRQETQY